jgi:hypothetical protein
VTFLGILLSSAEGHLFTSSDQRVMKNIIVQIAQMIRTAVWTLFEFCKLKMQNLQKTKLGVFRTFWHFFGK